jgi:RNA polymerase sigma-70 factor (ECF subfamily)
LAEQFHDLSEEELFDEVLRRRANPAGGEDFNTPLGELCERWKKPAAFVIRRVQASYRAGGPDDEPELFQESVRKLVEKGLDQYRGVSEQVPGKSASPKTFFLRIVKHVTIDRYRRARELLAPGTADDSDAPEDAPAEVAVATNQAKRAREREDAKEIYWAAFARLKKEHPNEAAAWDLYHHQDVEDHEECARALGITVVNSYKRVSRAQAYLRAYLLELSGHD